MKITLREIIVDGSKALIRINILCKYFGIYIFVDKDKLRVNEESAEV